jgi:hypothetical protein
MLLEERAYLCERDAPAHDKTHQCVGNLFNPGSWRSAGFFLLCKGNSALPTYNKLMAVGAMR